MDSAALWHGRSSGEAGRTLVVRASSWRSALSSRHGCGGTGATDLCLTDNASPRLLGCTARAAVTHLAGVLGHPPTKRARLPEEFETNLMPAWFCYASVKRRKHGSDRDHSPTTNLARCAQWKMEGLHRRCRYRVCSKRSGNAVSCDPRSPHGQDLVLPWPLL